MTDRELNERLFDIALPNIFPGQDHNYQQTGDSIKVWVHGRLNNTIVDFSPATSVDDLRKWVLPELERRGLSEQFSVAVANIGMGQNELVSAESFLGPDFIFHALKESPSTLAAAALEVLEASNAHM